MATCQEKILIIIGRVCGGLVGLNPSNAEPAILFLPIFSTMHILMHNAHVVSTFLVLSPKTITFMYFTISIIMLCAPKTRTET